MPPTKYYDYELIQVYSCKHCEHIERFSGHSMIKHLLEKHGIKEPELHLPEEDS